MADLNDSDVRIQVLIEEKTPEGFFRDALYFSKLQDYLDLHPDDKAAMKAERVNNHVAFIQAARTAKPVEPTVEELEAIKQSIDEQIAAATAQKEEIEQKILEVSKISVTPVEEIAVK